jgi:hypothetical protein
MRGTFFALAASAFVAGCSTSSAAVNETPTDAGTADAAPTEPKGDFTCLGKISYPAPATTTANISMKNPKAENNQPAVGLTVKACAIDDTTCAKPLATAPTTKDDGIAAFPALPLGATGFGGYFEATIAGEPPNLNFVSPPIYRDVPYQRIYYSGEIYKTLLDSISVIADPTRGAVLIEPHDCTEFKDGKWCHGDPGCVGHVPGGVSFDLDVKDAKIVRAYIVIPKISTTATATMEGFGGGFINVPAGPVTLTSKVEATGAVVGTMKLFVRAGALSLVTAAPTP